MKKWAEVSSWWARGTLAVGLAGFTSLKLDGEEKIGLQEPEVEVSVNLEALFKVSSSSVWYRPRACYMIQ